MKRVIWPVVYILGVVLANVLTERYGLARDFFDAYEREADRITAVRYPTWTDPEEDER